MRRSLAVLVGCSVIGCGALDEFRDAPPTLEEVTISVPSAKGTTGQGLNQALVGATSEFYLWTLGTSEVINGSALVLLGTLRTVILLPPTSRTADRWTWGPYTPGGLDPLTYRVIVTRTAPKKFSFTIDGRARDSASDADYLALLDGEIERSAPRVGKGTMALHFDNRRMLRPNTCEVGTITFEFDNTRQLGTTAPKDPWIDVTFTQFANNNPQSVFCKTETPHDAVYHFDRAADGSGNYLFQIDANLHGANDNKLLLEQVTMRSRWLGSGAGRGDVKVSGGEVATDLAAAMLPNTFVSASQCWSTSFLTVYQTSSPAVLNLLPTSGNESDCAFPSQLLP